MSRDHAFNKEFSLDSMKLLENMDGDSEASVAPNENWFVTLARYSEKVRKGKYVYEAVRR